MTPFYVTLICLAIILVVCFVVIVLGTDDAAFKKLSTRGDDPYFTREEMTAVNQTLDEPLVALERARRSAHWEI